jgi:hypothetical protein
MTNLEGMHSYFWLVSSRMKTSVGDDIPYTDQALKQDLLRVRNAWDDCQASRARDAIYSYLTAVFDLVAWWMAENRALERAQKALRLRHITPFDQEDPFAAVPLIQLRSTSALARSGPLLSGGRSTTSRIPSRWIDS